MVGGPFGMIDVGPDFWSETEKEDNYQYAQGEQGKIPFPGQQANKMLNKKHNDPVQQKKGLWNGSVNLGIDLFREMISYYITVMDYWPDFIVMHDN
jgi:hypothetical protein